MNKKVATIISRIFDPFVVLTITLILLFIRGGESASTIGISLLFTIGLPLILTIIAVHKKVVGNWDVSDRRQRPKALGVLLGVEFINLIILKYFVSAGTYQTLLFLFIALIGFSVITLFWKISGHTMANALATGLIINFLGLEWWPIVCIVLLVGWARVVKRDHTILQAAAGAAYSWVLLVLFESLMFGFTG